jgi:hypothetical protein
MRRLFGAFCVVFLALETLPSCDRHQIMAVECMADIVN